MSPAATEFRLLFADLLESRSDDADMDFPTDLLVDVDGRPVQARLDEAGALHLSTAIFFPDDDTALIDRQAIAEFNAYHLFRGGYCLLVDQRSGALYVDQAMSVQSLGRDTRDACLADFAERSGSCARWYATECAARNSSATSSAGEV